MNESIVFALLKTCWDGASDLRYRSLVTSILVRDTFGGEIVTSEDVSGDFSNRILGTDYNFSDPSAGSGSMVLERPDLLEHVPQIAAVLGPMREKWRRTLRRRLALSDTSHVIIQDEADNAGSYSNPDFSCVIITADSVERLNTSRFFPGQAFWLKRTNGPIVAMGRLDRWITGERHEWRNQDLRSVTHGLPISHRPLFWRRLEENPDRAFLLAFFTVPAALDVPRYPAVRSHGRRVIDLSDIASEVAWLYADGSILNLPPEGPPPHQFHRGFHFRWESLLSPEVSAALDERTPRTGRFRERVATVNTALLEYFAFLDAVSNDDVLASFTDDQLTLIAELCEEAPSDCPRINYLIDVLREIGHARVHDPKTSGIAAEMLSLSETLRQLQRGHAVVILDEAMRRAATLERAAPRRDWLEITDEE